MNLEAELNAEQLKAVRTTEGAVLIIAGAGSGKTRVITFRIANMLQKGILQSQILALTFTNKAAREMKLRIKELTGQKLQNLTISTFHAFGVKVLRKYIHLLGWRENFSIYDETDKGQLIKDCGRELKFSSEDLNVYELGILFSQIKGNIKDWDSNSIMYKPIFDEYQSNLKLYNAVDFDDLILLPMKILTSYPEALVEIKARYKYIMVDEFQDTSLQQYQFLKLLVDKNICVVGDDDQSIYSWRGANYENIKMFETDFPNLSEIKLEQNYRSTETILAAANGVISNNKARKKKALWSKKGSGKPIEIYFPNDEKEEASFIADKILVERADLGLKYSDFCVLVRANHLTRALEEAFLEVNLPYHIAGGMSFFQRKEIKDIISYLRVFANPDDDVNLLRIINTPRRGIGKKTIETISDIASDQKSTLNFAIQKLLYEEGAVAEKKYNELKLFSEFLKEQRKIFLSGSGLAKKVRSLVDKIRYFDFLLGEHQKNEKTARFKFLNIEHLIQSIDEWENNPDNLNPNLFAYLNRITLLTRDDGEEEDKGEVQILTIHAAKGLEFPVVFIAGVEEGVIPHARSLEENDGDVEEERRLFYVAITRAQKKLFLTSCRHRRHLRDIVECTPSSFIKEIPAELVTYHEPKVESSNETRAKIFANMLKKFGSEK
ncbi:MAG: 3'-5' exonuclease [Treponemataceae bacterium]